MKNSKQYAQNIQKIYRSLKRKYPKVKKVEYEDILEALMHSLVLEHMTETVTKAAFRRFPDYFIDFNDMRVSRSEEIVEMLGEDSTAAKTVASNIIKALTTIFRKYNTINLESLRKAGKRQARATLEKFDSISSFCVDYCLLTAMGGHAIPLTEKMVQLLKDNELVHPSADANEIGGFLARQISASNAYEFYSLLRRESETQKDSKKKATTTTRRKSTKSTKKKKTKKKTTKKKTAT
ncbi:MAG: hypothetical protein PVG93_05055 [Phycisphaerales bacterium]|jgi:hypothetical protein